MEAEAIFRILSKPQNYLIMKDFLDNILNFKEHNPEEVSKHSLLLSAPMLDDMYFSRSVIYLCEKNEEDTFGLILNNPLHIKIGELIPELEDYAFDVSFGGPVETDAVFVLHTFKDIPNSVEVDNGVFFGGDFDLLKELIFAGKATSENLRFFLGYSGWEPNQINEELEANTWLVAQEFENADLFSTHQANSQWVNIVNRLKDKYRILKDFPVEPLWN